MTKYNKSGVAEDGSVDPLRKRVGNIMHIFSLLGPGVVDREMADDLYQTRLTGEPHGIWRKVGAGNGGKEEEDGGKKKPPGIKDIDFPVKRRQASMADIYKPKVQKTLKNGGVVRGCGAAQRGKTRGKMV